MSVEEVKMDEVFVFLQSLSKETDRGCALIAAAYLDVEIENLLSKHFVPNNSVKNEILGQSRPLGTFSSRIDLAYLLGLIGPKVNRDLHLVRKIRNDFAHNPQPINFDDESPSNRCRELVNDAYGEANTPRLKFERCVMGLLGILHTTINRVTSIEEAKDPSVDDAKKRVREILKPIIEESET